MVTRTPAPLPRTAAALFAKPAGPVLPAGPGRARAAQATGGRVEIALLWLFPSRALMCPLPHSTPGQITPRGHLHPLISRA